MQIPGAGLLNDELEASVVFTFRYPVSIEHPLPEACCFIYSMVMFCTCNSIRMVLAVDRRSTAMD